MQANCPQCANKIVIDDARVPEKPFSVKCPKCQTAVRFPGKAAAAAAAEPDPGSSASAEPHMPAQPRREMTGEKALVALGDRGQAGAITLTLTRQGYAVDTLDDLEEGARSMEQGVYNLVVTTPTVAAAGKAETLYQKINRLTPDARRKLFVILVADNVKTGDGTQAWALQGDLVVTSKEVGGCDKVLVQTTSDRARMYQCFFEAQRRNEEGAR